MRYLILFLFPLYLAVPLGAEESGDERLEWFRQAKLGIFIHWGIYAVDGIDESWAFFNKYISYEDYMQQLDGFTAEHYDPQAWAELVADSGARYAVLTTKHHDGVALWHTDLSDLNVVEKTPAGRDLVAPFVKALRKPIRPLPHKPAATQLSHPLRESTSAEAGAP